MRLFLISLIILGFLFKINAQNVGVGTLIPSAKLHVQGNVEEVVRLDGIEPLLVGMLGLILEEVFNLITMKIF